MAKKLGTEPAFPRSHTDIDANSPFFKLGDKGISQRLYLAGMALQGILSNTELLTIITKLAVNNASTTSKYVAKASYVYADELLKEEYGSSQETKDHD